MGVYIPGMEMPETCKACFLSEFDAGFYAYICRPIGIRIDYEMAKIARPQRICPLVPVPEHGRLIDADEALQKLPDVAYKGSVRRVLMQMPTIIPVDKESENGL